GTLSSIGTIAAELSPTSIAVHPSGKFAYVTNSGTNNVSIYSVDASGALTLIGNTIPVATVSAASFQASALASESIASAFGTNLANSISVAATIPLPTSLNGTSLKVKDANGDERLSPLFFVSPFQVNYQIPSGAANGEATVTVVKGEGGESSGKVQISSVSRGIFTANANGQGVPAAVILRVQANGSQTFEPVAVFDQAQN